MDGQHQTNIPPPRRGIESHLEISTYSYYFSNLPSEIIINNECITGSEKIASTLNKYFASVAEQFQDKILKESSNAYSEQFAMKALLC